jgi:hypothetical protein
MVAIALNPNTNEPVITWKKLPDGYPIPDDSVDNINQPPIAAALTDSLHQSGHLTPPALATTDYGLCATVNGKTIGPNPGRPGPGCLSKGRSPSRHPPRPRHRP